MKKSALIAAIALPVAYTGSAWYLGQRIETSLNDQAKQVEGLPSIKVVKRDYQRGLFSSTETVTFELMGDVTRAMQQAGGPAMEAVKITVRSDIRHGPWLGGAEFDAGVANAELVLEGEAKEWVKKVFGDRKPIEVRTIYHFAGGGRSDFSSPGFTFDLPVSDPSDALRVVWDGVTARVDFEEGMARYTLQGSAPKMEMTDAKGGRIVMQGLNFSGDQARLFADDPLLYTGTQRFTLDSFGIHDPSGTLPPVELAKVVYEVDIPKQGDFIDLIARIGSEKLTVAGANYGPAHYDFSFRHLHAQTASRMYRSFVAMSSDPQTMLNPEAMQAQMGQLMGPALELLGHAPVIAIDRLAFNTPQGPASLNARVALAGITPDDLSNPLGLLAKLDAAGELSLPEVLVRETVSGRNQGQIYASYGEEADPQEVAAMANAMFDQQLTTFVDQGLVSRTNGQLTVKAAFSKGQLTVNGQPFNPAAMGAMPQ